MPKQGPARGVYDYHKAEEAKKAAKATGSSKDSKGKGNLRLRGSTHREGKGKGSFAEMIEF